MIVERLVWTVEPGKRAQFIEFLSSYLREKTNQSSASHAQDWGVGSSGR